MLLNVLQHIHRTGPHLKMSIMSGMRNPGLISLQHRTTKKKILQKEKAARKTSEVTLRITASWVSVPRSKVEVFSPIQVSLSVRL